MKICWDNIVDIYIPKRKHAKCDFRNSKGQKFIYMESCKECGYPFLSQVKAKGEFCDKSCKAKYENPKNKWKHGTQHYHRKAYELFGKDKCENCGCDENPNERFSMHNTLEPKNYTVMESYAWQCLCRICHNKIDSYKEGIEKYKMGL